MTDFTGKIALVTGAASGIGLGIAQRFIKDGATVVGTDINPEGIAAVAKQLGDKFVPLASDAGNVNDIETVINTIKEKFDRLDCLVNNAGIGEVHNPVDMTEEQYDAGMNVLLKGPMFFVKYAAPLLRKAEDGCVVNISSGSSVLTAPDYTPYATAKAAIDKFTRDCTVQVMGVRHNSVQPGFIKTPIVEQAYSDQPDILATISSITPSKTYGMPEDIANMVAFLCSDQASFVNGANIPVDGGLAQVHAMSMEYVATALS